MKEGNKRKEGERERKEMEDMEVGRKEGWVRGRKEGHE